MKIYFSHKSTQKSPHFDQILIWPSSFHPIAYAFTEYSGYPRFLYICIVLYHSYLFCIVPYLKCTVLYHSVLVLHRIVWYLYCSVPYHTVYVLYHTVLFLYHTILYLFSILQYHSFSLSYRIVFVLYHNYETKLRREKLRRYKITKIQNNDDTK